MPEPTLDRLAWRLDRVEADRKEDEATVDGLLNGVGYAQDKLKDLAHEVDELRRVAKKAEERADRVAKLLELKEREAEAEARARSMVAKWLQIGLGALVVIGTVWSGKLVTGVDQLRALLGGGR